MLGSTTSSPNHFNLCSTELKSQISDIISSSISLCVFQISHGTCLISERLVGWWDFKCETRSRTGYLMRWELGYEMEPSRFTKP